MGPLIDRTCFESLSSNMLFIGAVDGIHISSWSTLDTNLSCIFLLSLNRNVNVGAL